MRLLHSKGHERNKNKNNNYNNNNNNNYNNNYNNNNYNINKIERHVFVRLRRSYRCHPAIASLLSRLFYRSQLQTDAVPRSARPAILGVMVNVEEEVRIDDNDKIIINNDDDDDDDDEQ